MAKIYWRNGTAWARATVKGVEHRESLGTTSAREAEVRFATWLTSVTSPSKWSKDETPFPVACDTFTDNHIPQLKRKSQARYLTSLLALRPHFEPLTLQKIGKKELMEFVAARRKDGVTNGTIRRDLACLSSLFTIAEDWELVEGNPVSAFMRVQKKRGLKEAPPKSRYLLHAEEWKLLAHCRNRYDAYLTRGSKRSVLAKMILAAFAVDIDTGLRSQELLTLRWPQVDVFGAEVKILASQAKNSTERRVPLLPRAQRILAGLPRHPDTDLVFWWANGRPFYDLNHTFQRLAAEMGIEGVTFHDLRRTCGCRLLQDHKLPIERVSLWLGHKTVKQTQDAYAFLNVRHLHEAVGTGGSQTDETVKMIGDLRDFSVTADEYRTIVGTNELVSKKSK